MHGKITERIIPGKIPVKQQKSKISSLIKNCMKITIIISEKFPM